MADQTLEVHCEDEVLQNVKHIFINGNTALMVWHDGNQENVVKKDSAKILYIRPGDNID